MRHSIYIILIMSAIYMLTGCATSSPLIKASFDGDLQTVKNLIAQGANIKEKNCQVNFDLVCCSAITCAAYRGNTEIVKYLHQKGADLNIRDGAGVTFGPIHYAAYFGYADLAHYLVMSGANLSVHADMGMGTPLTIAKMRNHMEVADIIANAQRDNYLKPSKTATSNNLGTSRPVVISRNTTVTNEDSTLDDLLKYTPTGKPAGKYDVAVIIANANYSTTGTPNVDFALQDAQIMKEYLIKTFGYDPANIIYIENATLTKFNEIFGTSGDYQGKLFSWIKPGQSKIFIYYVGHGAPDQQTGEGYFVPVDANPQFIRANGYKLSTFYENISKLPALKKTVVIDACFSGSSANGQLLKGVSGLTARLKSEPKATVAADLLLTSAGMDQVASWYPEKGHSLFTYFFLKGIQGEADSNKDGRITMGEMKAWLNDQVPYMARRITGNQQQPVLIGKDNEELAVINQ